MSEPTRGYLAVTLPCPTCEGWLLVGSCAACPDCMDEHGFPTGTRRVPAHSDEWIRDTVRRRRKAAKWEMEWQEAHGVVPYGAVAVIAAMDLLLAALDGER